MHFDLVYKSLLLGFSLGLLHATDVDHLMAVSVLASNKTKKIDNNPLHVKHMIQLCSAWAIGHGLTLLVLTTILVFLGKNLPENVSHFSEKLIGLLILLMGLWILWQLIEKKISFFIPINFSTTYIPFLKKTEYYAHHQPVLIGMIHGLAGSSPILALIPALEESNSLLICFSYVAMFSLGVLIMILILGTCFAYMQNILAKFGSDIYQFSRLLIASVALGFGTYWLLR